MPSTNPDEWSSADASPPSSPGRHEGGAFTGERPGWGAGFEYDYARHVAAYRFAEQLVAGKRVLDAGCGEGFGTRTLAATAREVVGLDYSSDAIGTCRRLWSGGNYRNLHFRREDLSAGAHAESDVFDVVLNFQVLEHMASPLPLLRGLASRLTPGGVLVLTTPNRLRTVSENPYHVREYTQQELARELGAVFGNVEIRGVFGNENVERFETRRAGAVSRILRLDPLGLRHVLPRAVVEFAFARLARIVRRRASPAQEPPIVPEDFRVGTGDIDRALDLLALCRLSPEGR
ncbi:MAG TPA: methyltransferase domain-containing protein [Candidatus Binatia bacterium]|jgi:SAM-dependent methyltransferase